MNPRVPSNLNPYCREVLEQLSHDPRSQSIIIGGGVALNHYIEHRTTVDFDGWWKTHEDPNALKAIQAVLEKIANRDGLTVSKRAWGDVASLELKTPDGHKLFSVQMAVRSKSLQQPIDSPWEGIKIETLHDNIASKMVALVNRSAPRDFMDIYTLCSRKAITEKECWQLYLSKTEATQEDLHAAKTRVAVKMQDLTKRRPLHSISDLKERSQADLVRQWVHTKLCQDHACKMEP